MKSTAFWLRRFALVMGAVFSLLCVIYLLQGQALGDAAVDALLWACIASTVFITTRYYHASRGRDCALCRDTAKDG